MSQPSTQPPTSLPLPVRERWTPLRAGIQNVWEYDDRRFVFSRGRLLLRGQNEAGKTKAMELLFPLLLDADLSPQRLDPFGTVSRPMRWNLINDANPETQLRVGYVWLEFGRLEEGRASYCTLGAGLKARRGSTDLDSWFFLTSQRPDQELSFLDETRHPLTRPALEEALGAAGQLFERQADYRRAVNARLFAVGEEQYTALVDTLLALRRPQLSKGLDLDQLSGFLSSALPPLDGRLLGPIAEGFERLDHHRAEAESLAENLRKLRRFEGVYRTYARTVAKALALVLTRAESGCQRARAVARDKVAEREALDAERTAVEQRVAELDRQELALQDRIRVLEGSDEYRAARDLDQAEQESRAAAGRLAAAEGRRDEDAQSEAGVLAERGRLELELRHLAVEGARARAEAARLAEVAALAGEHATLDGLAVQLEAGALRTALEALAARRETLLGRLRALHRKFVQAQAAHRLAEERLRQREEEVRLAAAALRAAEVEAAAGLEAWREAAEGWRARLEVLPVRLLPDPAGDDGPSPAAGFIAAVGTQADLRRLELASDRAGAASRASAARAEAATLTAEREGLVSAPHPTPPAPHWRPGRPAQRAGAPLYLLCDFGPGCAGQEAGLEAALEASGLLDGWVTPGGALLDPRTEDAVLTGPPAGGRTLADLLVPVEAGGVGLEAARRALEAVGFAEAGEEPVGSCWVSVDGRWRVGPLRGAWSKATPSYVGATARELERARRIALLDARLAALALQRSTAEEEEQSALLSLASLARELASLPSTRPLEASRLRVELRAEVLAGARAQVAEAERSAAVAAEAATLAARSLDAEAGAGGVGAFARDPERLAEVTHAWVRAGEALVQVIGAQSRAQATATRAEAAAAEAARRAQASRADVEGAREEAVRAEARAGALRGTSGVARAALLATLAEARSGVEAARQGRTQASHDKSRLDEQAGARKAEAEQAEADVARTEEERQEGARAFRAQAGTGLLAAAALPPAEPPEGWSYTATLEEARRVDGAIEVGVSPEERERAEDRVMRDASELERQLPAGARVVPSRSAEVLSYAFTWNGRTRPALELLLELESELTARTALLGEQESELLEQFLSGEAHDHLASRLRQARALVDRMNQALEPRTTAAGAQVRLAWGLDDTTEQADARAAVPLFFLSGQLLSEANRRALRQFLERRLAQARDAASERSLQERLLEVLDYRRWHRFQVEHREPGRPWTALTRKAHGAGSGGKKAVMLHLPLFAAAAAFYDSAGPAAPRLVALDEAFAGIDRPTRGRLMGLLAEFDLDFLMTSFEEWGFYAELDGLSTYHLSRVPGHRGVHAEWFVWDGKERTLVEES
jgi:uncharacterized protein (TIGR02680 family)